MYTSTMPGGHSRAACSRGLGSAGQMPCTMLQRASSCMAVPHQLQHQAANQLLASRLLAGASPSNSRMRSPLLNAPLPVKDRFKGSSRRLTRPTSTGSSLGSMSNDHISREARTEECTSPLMQALQQAQARHEEAQRVTGALEAEAQEVAQLAVEASEARNSTRSELLELLAALEQRLAAQQEAVSRAATLRSQLDTLQVEGGVVSEELQTEVVIAERTAREDGMPLAGLRARIEAAQAQALAADAAAAQAEAVAGAAMKAAETAVQDEMEAAAVVKEIELALSKTRSELSTLTDSNVANASTDLAMEAAKAGLLPPLGSPDGSKGPALKPYESSQDAKALASASADLLANAPVDGKAAAAEPFPWVPVIVAGVGILATFAFSQTAAGSGFFATAAEKAAHFMLHLHAGEKALLETIFLLLTSIVCVPLVVKTVPGGSPVLGYLLGGALIGPHALSLIADVESIKHLAEMGVVFLLFNIGLELSLDRLASMAKFVFGMGTAQVVLTLAGVAGVAIALTGMSGPSAIILGGALAMSSTAVAIQVLEERSEMGSRHGRAIFSVLLLQDLAVVVLLMLIPLLAPSESGAAGGMAVIAQALGLAAVKAAACIVAIMAGGRIIVQPVYKWMSNFANAEIFAATTLLVVLGTSFLTQLAGLSLALGAFLAGLLIAETEYALQVESDIAPYKGLLMGLFFMSVGMEISGQLFLAKWREVLLGIVLLIGGKLAVMAAVGPLFGLSTLASVRAGLLLAPGGEFAFVAFGEAVAKGVLPGPLTNLLYLVVALSMALTPYLASAGAKLGHALEKTDMKALQPDEGETKELSNHVIIAGYGRVGQIISQMLSEQLIPFVALEVQSDRVQLGKSRDLPVYFGDAGSPAVLHLVGAERAACAVIALDTPGANYRAVWALNKHYPKVKTYVRAHDINHGINLEKAGATAVVPETLEPSLQLTAAVLSELEFTGDEVSTIVDDFRRKHLGELVALTEKAGTSLGYGFRTRPPAVATASLPAGTEKALIAATVGTASNDGNSGGGLIAALA